MIVSYERDKANVLELYGDFLAIVRESGLPEDNKSIIALRNQAENIKQDRLVLMVAGEAKSGKSTFINAFLGQKILPMDVKQCTSALIEIKYGTEFTLEATYADNRTKKITDVEKIKSFLVDNAALNDEYRDIPVTVINNEILIKYQGKVPDRVINDLINNVADDNIYGLPLNEYKKKIRLYIEENKGHWADIVTKMVITYKFEDESLKGIEIIDSPGVNAEGRVGEIADNYIENANAIMFLKPVTGAALGSTSFKKFLESKSVERNKNVLFLLLTRAANETSANLDRMRAEALKLYGKTVNEEQIICIDSRIKLFINEIYGLSDEEIEKRLVDLENNSDTFLNPPMWLTRNFSKGKYIEYLKNKSNFFAIEQALNIYGRKSHYLLLSDFLHRIIKVCGKIEDNLNEQINLNKLKIKDPSELAMQIADIKNKIIKINVKMGKTVNEIVSQYTGDDGIVKTEAKEVVNAYLSAIHQISADADNEDAIDELEKVSFRLIDKAKKFQEEMQKNIVAECDQALIELSNKEAINYASLEPDFTPEIFDEIINVTKKDAYVERSYETGWTFKKTHRVSEYSRKKHFEILKSSISERINNIGNQATDNLVNFAIITADVYIKELAANGKTKQEELDRIMEEKKETEAIMQMIESMTELISHIIPLVDNAKEIKGGIETNAQ